MCLSALVLPRPHPDSPAARALAAADPEELAEYRLRKRKEFEDLLRRVGRWQPGVWVKVGAMCGREGVNTRGEGCRM